jgi:hypothetical protein
MTLNASKSARVAASWVVPWPQEASANEGGKSLARTSAWSSVPIRLMLDRLIPDGGDAGQAEVTDLGEQAVEGGLVDDGPGDPGQAGVVAGDLQAVEPGRPAAVQHAADADLVEARVA